MYSNDMPHCFSIRGAYKTVEAVLSKFKEKLEGEALFGVSSRHNILLATTRG